MREIVLQITMWVVTVCTYISYCPQLYKIIKTKHSEDLSIASWVLWLISSIANTVYSVALGRVELIVASVSELLLILATLLLTVFYSKCWYTLNVNMGNMYSWYYNTSCGEHNLSVGCKVDLSKEKVCRFCGKQIALRARAIKPVAIKRI